MKTSPWLVATYVVIIAFGILTALPNILSTNTLNSFPSWFPKDKVALGLDLRGGSHLVLEVDSADLVQERLQSLIQDSRRALRDDGVDAATVRKSGSSLVVTLQSAEQRAAALTALGKLAHPVGLTGAPDLAFTGEGATISITLAEAGITDRANAGVEQSLEIIRQRIDQVGVAEPTIQRIGGDRILVQLPVRRTRRAFVNFLAPPPR